MSRKMVNKKEGTLEYYLEMSDEDFENEMDRFEKDLEEMGE